jgi:FkbM family methyltransferase
VNLSADAAGNRSARMDPAGWGWCLRYRGRRAIIWLKRLERIRDSMRLLGFPCTAKFLAARVLRVPVIRVRPRGQERRFWVRTKDSDFLVLFHVFGERELDIELPTQPRLIVDAGAYTGYSTCYFAHRYPTSKVVAIEPVATNITLLEEHCRGMGHVTIERAALWPTLGNVAIDNPGEKSWAFRTREARGGTTVVPTITIPEILRRTGESRIDLLKLDIEGAEEMLFREGADEWLPKVDVMAIELHGPACAKAMEDAIARHHLQRVDLGEKVILRREGASVRS